MPPWTLLGKRVLLSLFALYLVVSATFAVVALTPDPNLGGVVRGVTTSAEYQQANESEREEMVADAVSSYRESRNLHLPLHQRYVRWLVDVATLQWGYSFSQDAPVKAVLGRAIPATLAYVLPAMLVGLVGSVGLGVYAALRPDSLLARVVSGGVYLGYGVPNFWFALVIPLVAGAYFGGVHEAVPGFRPVVLPAAILGLSLLAGQLRYVKAESREYVNTEFVKLVRAKGASTRRVAGHVLRNAAVPILSVFFVDLLGVLVVNVFILEAVLNIPGIGTVGLAAIHQRDLPMILGVTMVLATVGVTGNLIQDLAYRVLDPRIDE